MSAAGARMQPLFLDGAAGRLFALLFLRDPEVTPRGAALFLPPFAEELNKSRRMLALQARALNSRGYDVLLPDLFGTGDSEGDFGDARWELWIDDAQRAWRWLAARTGTPISVLALRTGALLAAELALLGSTPERLALWQPVLSGPQFVTQFLRLRLAAGMLAGQRGGMTELRSQLAADGALEVAGYELSASLARALEARSVEARSLAAVRRVGWFEMVARADQPLSVPSRKLISALQTAGQDVRVQAVAGASFWSTPEIAVVPELIDHTSSWFVEGSA